MMKELLENYFGTHYGSTKHATAECQLLKGKFSFADPKACRDCLITDGCDHAVMKCDVADNEIEAIQFETFVDNYTHLKKISKGTKCDLLLVDKHKIVFCDMTCSNAKYIVPFTMKDGTLKEGKRQTAREQVCNSITLVNNVPEIAVEIQTKKAKIALFAYRVKDEVKKDDFDTQTFMNMRKFSSLQDKAQEEPMFSDLANGFLFTEVKYPNTYQW